MVDIIYHHGKAHQNHNEIITSHMKEWLHSKDNKKQVLTRMWSKRNPCALSLEMLVDTATMENIMEVPQKIKTRTTI